MARILIADEDRLFRSALAVVLGAEGHQVVAHCGSLEEVRPALASDGVVDLVLASSGLAEGGRLFEGCAEAHRPRLLVLSLVCEHDRLLGALEAGAQGYLAKDVGLDELMLGLGAVLRGEAYVPPPMLGGLLHELVQQRRTVRAPSPSRLSRREQEVLELLAQGHGQTSIARELVISPQTARTHIQKVVSKLGAHSRGEAVALAVREGLVAS